ncbi:hypothetical protein NQ317_008084 [Molorchus minor]|uniref:THAP-type domain-containing protein n=1 Tax=Molorchus minor TaxID=1323400 RepID=A0ABQ9IV28_9CUCU|nr:hypothetical protein NQ317_008084 [Molorchus minor]
MPRCIVKDCIYNKSANCKRDKDSIHLFRFPKNHERQEVWRVALNLQIEDVFIMSTVCHLHFDEELFDYEKSPFRLHLKQDAVPSLGARDMGQLNIISSPEPSTSSDVFFTDYHVPPSNSSGFHEENVIPELSPRPFTSLGFVENKTAPSSPLRTSSLDNTPENED